MKAYYGMRMSKRHYTFIIRDSYSDSDAKLCSPAVLVVVGKKMRMCSCAACVSRTPGIMSDLTNSEELSYLGHFYWLARKQILS